MTRLSPQAEETLRQAGWYPGRQVPRWRSKCNDHPAGCNTADRSCTRQHWWAARPCYSPN